MVVIEREMQSLPREDRELAMALCSQLTAQGIRNDNCAMRPLSNPNKRR